MTQQQVDFESEGLLEGVDGDAREARRELLEKLLEEGVPLEELRQAVEEDRLVLLPVERELLGSGERLTGREVAERAGLELEFWERLGRSLGLAVGGSDEPLYGEFDLEGAKRVKRFLDAGFPEQTILDVNRVMGLSLSQIARALGDVTTSTLIESGAGEREVALGLAAAQRELGPVFAQTMEYVLRRQQLEVARQSAVTGAEIAAGRVAGAREVSVAFADLVGFTRLGEELPPEDVGSLADRLNDMALEVTEPPVRLVKMIGDAAMLASPDPDALLESGLGLLGAAEAEGDGFPQLRVGVACGPALARAGDLYGRPVNLASRITAIARPGSALATSDVREHATSNYDWTHIGRRRVKGVRGGLDLYRVRPGAGGD
ncbi:MAG: adenylate cyclase regulatory domain-containing protein [Thermoleophilaceae bacterium]